MIKQGDLVRVVRAADNEINKKLLRRVGVVESVESSDYAPAVIVKFGENKRDMFYTEELDVIKQHRTRRAILRKVVAGEYELADAFNRTYYNPHGLVFVCEAQEPEVLADIRKRIDDDNITCASFSTHSGDYEPLFVGYTQPGYKQENDNWWRVKFKKPQPRLSRVRVYIAPLGNYIATSFDEYSSLTRAKQAIRDIVRRYDDEFVYTTPLKQLTVAALLQWKSLQIGYWPSTGEELVITINV